MYVLCICTGSDLVMSPASPCNAIAFRQNFKFCFVFCQELPCKSREWGSGNPNCEIDVQYRVDVVGLG